MKISVDVHTVMKSAVSNVFENMSLFPITINLDDGIEFDTDFFFISIGMITRSYKEDFFKHLETEFNEIISTTIFDQFSKYGLDYLYEDSE